jgi:hypothetical protein
MVNVRISKAGALGMKANAAGGVVSSHHAQVQQLMRLAIAKPTEAALNQSLTNLVKGLLPKLTQSPDGFEPVAAGAVHDAPAPELAASRSVAAYDTMRRTLRALAAVNPAADATGTATTALSHQALRHWLTGIGWQVVADSLGARAAGDTRVAPSVAGVLHTLRASEAGPASMLRIARAVDAGLAEAGTPKTKAAATAQPLSPQQARALVDALTAVDANHAGAIRERLAGPNPLSGDVTLSAWERKLPLIAPTHDSAALPVETVAPRDAKLGGLVFDLGTNTWVQRDRSWTYKVNLRNVLEYQVSHKGKGIINGPNDVANRLYNMSRDPLSNTSSLDQAQVQAFLLDLAEVARDPKAGTADDLLDQPFDLTFSTANGGDVPVGASWQLPDGLSAKLFAALSDPARSGAIAHKAAQLRDERLATRESQLKPLAPLLAKYTGQPVRHKRAHGALINVNEKLGMSFAQVSAEDGPIPKSTIYLTPDDLRTQHATTQNLKVRYLFNDTFELGVISDEQFKEVQNAMGFPPNHEFLALGSEIYGSGYLTIHEGKIVNVHDDIVTEPGKLPLNLPPALEVMRALDYPLDEAKILSAHKVLNFDLFKQSLKQPATFNGPKTGGVPPLAAYFEGLSPTAVPGEVAGWVRAQFAAGVTPDTLVRDLTRVLEHFEIGSVSAFDFRKGDLPKHLNDYSDLTMTEELSRSLVRMATSP